MYTVVPIFGARLSAGPSSSICYDPFDKILIFKWVMAFFSREVERQRKRWSALQEVDRQSKALWQLLTLANGILCSQSTYLKILSMHENSQVHFVLFQGFMTYLITSSVCVTGRPEIRCYGSFVYLGPD